jgi:hypothetical protein
MTTPNTELPEKPAEAESLVGIDSTDLLAHSVQLAKISHELDEWVSRINEIPGFDGFGTPATGNFEIMNVILDLWGIPAENMPEDIENDWVNGEHYCREMWRDVWDATVVARRDYEMFVRAVSRQIELPAMGWNSDGDELTFLFYGANV